MTRPLVCINHLHSLGFKNILRNKNGQHVKRRMKENVKVTSLYLGTLDLISVSYFRFEIGCKRIKTPQNK